MLDALRWTTLGLLSVSSLLSVYFAASVRVPMAARLGHRGAEKRRALEEQTLYAIVEPLTRFLAGVIAFLPLKRLREKLEHDLMQADYCLGLTPNELLGLSLISSVLLGASIAALTMPFGLSSWFAVAATFFGSVLPQIQVKEVIRKRVKVVTRELPNAIEIASMCMGAGLDFPGALRQIVGARKDNPNALHKELGHILDRLELGHTRKAALQGFADRVPGAAIRDFASAVIQAEEKGNPLAEVIRVQGRMLSMRRSVLAEEAAARAGVLLIGPMMLLVVCILLLLVGPFLVTGGGL